MGGQGLAPAPLCPAKRPITLVQKAPRPQGQFGRVQRISPTSGLDPLTAQSVVNR